MGHQYFNSSKSVRRILGLILSIINDFDKKILIFGQYAISKWPEIFLEDYIIPFNFAKVKKKIVSVHAPWECRRKHSGWIKFAPFPLNRSESLSIRIELESFVISIVCIDIEFYRLQTCNWKYTRLFVDSIYEHISFKDRPKRFTYLSILWNSYENSNVFIVIYQFYLLWHHKDHVLHVHVLHVILFLL